MRKNKYNPELLKEELKRVQMLMEFEFPGLKEDYDDKSVILNGIDEEEDMSDETDAVANDLGIDPNGGAPANPNTAPAPDMGAPAPAPTDPNAAPAPDMGAPAPDMGAPAPDAGGESEEIDVTGLVNGTEEAKNAAEEANHTSEILLKKLADLEAKLGRMDAVGAKIETLEKEIIKRNPTPVEKLELQSLHSAPFNQKLGDYWSEKEGAYDVMNQEKNEYVLTKDDIDGNYSDVDIKKSFGVNDNEYEEEDI